MNQRFLYFILLSIILIGACQYPVDNSTLPASKQYIVIDAEITPSYSKVLVTYSLTGVTSLGGYSFPKIPKSTVYVLDSRGSRTNITKTDGTVDSTFRGIIGETYQLFVDIDGKKYESKPEKMLSCPAIDSLSAPYRRENFRAESDLFYDGFDVYAFTKDEPNKENFYQWEWIHYERASFCDRKNIASEGGEVLIPCLPFGCWNIFYSTNTIVLSDKLRDGNQIAQQVARVPFKTQPSKYYLRVIQRAITPSVYAYLKSIETQTQSTGTLFDVPAQTRFSPNIYNTSNLDEKILGVFSVFSFQKKLIYVDLTQKIDGATPKIITETSPFTTNIFLSSPCTEGLYRTKIKPEGWVD